ncbi:MAG TPA: VWA domain-containing protein [Pyrinomonadaceae bacterium]|jgi:VWFA-related protein|nr:VWA domain-containing protein [Pyrinomonadaceae bacterium]
MRESKTVRRLLAALCASLVCALLAAHGGGAQEKKKDAKPEQPLTVKLGALVLDSQDKPVGGLGLEDFQLLEDGVPQKIATLERLEGPQVFGLLVDCSGSMRDRIGKVIDFGKSIVAGTDAGSEGFVVCFIASDNIKVMQDVTADKARLASAFDDVFVEGGQTAINDALYLAAGHVAKYKQTQTGPRRYSLVIVTDGEDRNSFYKTEQVFEKLKEAGARVFVAGLVGGYYQKGSPEKAKQYMSRLAYETGGSAHFVKKVSELPQAAEQILQEMGAGYVLGYDSTNPKRDGSARKLQLTVSGGAGGEQRKVSTADGYVAPKK